jgi:RNA polymerase sigma factor (sigma-70 family)
MLSSQVPIPNVTSLAARRRLHPQLSDLEQLVAAAAAGDQCAWNTILGRFGGCVRSAARAQRLSTHDVEDVVQVTWMRLLEHLSDIREPDRLGAWLQTTARREGLRHLHAGRREQPADEEFFERQPTHDDADQRIATAERAVALDCAVQTLTGRYREVIRMLLADPEPSYAEVAAATGMPIGSIGPIRARSLDRLRRHPAMLRAA